MKSKTNFIKRERSNDKNIPAAKEPYRGVSWTNSNDENTNGTTNNHKRKDEPFVLMFRNFIFFDVKSYECRNGDLYIRNIVDGTILKRYFRMDGDDQLTVFKNRLEFDEFMKKVEEKGYLLGPDKHIEFKKEDSEPGIYSLLLKQASDNFVLENFTATRNSETGKIDLITSTWDGSSVTRDECPGAFDDVVRVLEKNPGSAQIFNRNDFM